MAVAVPPTSTSTTTTSLASDKAIRPFLAPTFDPVDYLNAVLPSYSYTPTPPSSRPPPSSTASTSTSSTSTTTTSLTELSSQSNLILSQLSAQLTRLSSTLSKLTDDILRAGGRLAYEVEVLRGDAGGLHEVLVEGLKGDIERFLGPGYGGLAAGSEGRTRARSRGTSLSVTTGPATAQPTTGSTINDTTTTLQPQATRHDPHPRSAEAALHQLRTLSLVRDRLESVIKVFGAAIEWVIPPSEVSSTFKSSFISVSGPDGAGGAEDVEAREKKGRAYSEKIRTEVGELASSGVDGEGESVDEGLRAALGRIEELRALVEVWKGTGEEKARMRFVEMLTKMVEERRRGQAIGTGTASGYRFRAESQARGGVPRR